VLGEVIGVGRCGTVVDWCEAESRAYAANYQAENIVNWRVERRGSRPVLSLVVVAETVWEDTDDLFAPKSVGRAAARCVNVLPASRWQSHSGPLARLVSAGPTVFR
jgi:hypothetical protein